MSLVFSGAEPQPSLAWQFESSNVDYVTNLQPSAQVSPGPAQLQGSAALVTNAPTSNTAVYFPGTAVSYMNLGVNSPTNFNYSTSNIFFEAWIYFNDLSTVKRIYVKDGFSFRYNSGNGKLGLYDGVGATAENNTVLSTGQWYHIAFSSVPGALSYTFVNGSPGTGIQLVYTGYNSATQWVISINSSQYFQGYIRDLRVVQGGVVPVATFTPLASAPFSYASPTYVANMGTTVFTLLGQFVTYNPSGKYGSSILFTNSYGSATAGTSNNYVSYNLPTTYQLSSGFAVSAWVKIISLSIGGQMQVININNTNTASGPTGNGTRFNIWAEGGVWRTYLFGGGSSISSGISITVGSWYHLVLCCDTSTTATLYVNGVATSAVLSGSVGYSVNVMYLASGGNGAQASYCEIDDLRIYNTALTAAQVRSVYSSQGAPAPSRAMPLPKLAWDFNGTTTDYVSGLAPARANVGGVYTSTTPITWPYYNTLTPKYGAGSLVLNNPTAPYPISNCVFYRNLSIPFGGSNGSTVCMWFKLLKVYTAGGDNTIFFISKNGGNLVTSIILGSAGKLVTYGFWVVPGGSGNFASTVVTNTLGIWYHVSLVTTSTSQTIYVNGTNPGVYDYSSTPIVGDSSNIWNSVALCSYDYGANPGYGASVEIDDLRIFDRALTSAQVQAIYNQQGVPGRGVQNTSTYTPTPIATLFGTTFSPLNVRTPAPDTSVAGQTTFTSAAGNYSDQGSIALTPLTTGLTVTVKFKLNSYSVNGGVFCLVNNITTNYYQLFLSGTSGSQKASVEMTTDSTSIGAVTPGVISTGTIYTITVVMQNNGYVYLYLDGVLYYSSTTPVTLVNRNYNIYIARERYGGMQSSLTVYDFRVINETLTSDKVLNLYKATTYNILTPKISLTGTPLFNQLSQAARSSAVGAFSLRAVNGTSARAVAVQAHPVVQWPPVAMTSNATVVSSQAYGNGTYYATESTGASNTSGTATFTMFDNNINTYYEQKYDGLPPSYYLGSYFYINGTSNVLNSPTTTVSGASVLGWWVQIQFPTSFILRNYTIVGRQNNNLFTTRMPSTFWIAGSNDGATWSNVHYQTGLTFAPQSGVNFTLPFTSNSVSYSYYRMIVSVIGSGPGNTSDILNIAAWNLYGDAPSYAPNASQDFYADRLGNLLTAPVTGRSLANWLGGATGYVTTWYDQSGAGNHATQSTAANQPIIQRATKGPGYCVYFSGSTTSSQVYLSGFSYSVLNNTNYSIVSITRRTQAPAAEAQVFLGTSSTMATNGALALGYENTSTRFVASQYGNDTHYTISGFTTASAEPLLYWSQTQSSSSGRYAYSSASLSTITTGDSGTSPASYKTLLNATSGNLRIGSAVNYNCFYTGEIYELLVFTQSLYDLDTSGGLITQIYNNQLSAYGT